MMHENQPDGDMMPVERINKMHVQRANYYMCGDKMYTKDQSWDKMHVYKYTKDHKMHVQRTNLYGGGSTMCIYTQRINVWGMSCIYEGYDACTKGQSYGDKMHVHAKANPC